jgi:signal transduction histidine kinase
MVSLLTLTGIGGALALAVLLTLVISPGFAELEERATDGYRGRAQTLLSDFAAINEVAAREQASAVASHGIGPTVPAHGIVYRRVAGEDGNVQGPSTKEARQAAAALDRLELEDLVKPGGSTRFYLSVDGNILAVGLAESPQGDIQVAVARRLTGQNVSRLLGRPVTLSSAAVAGNATTSRSTQFIDIAVPVYGPEGRPVASARFQVSREVVLLGRRVLLLAAAASILLLVLLLLMLRRALGRFVLVPLDRVERHMQRVQASGALLPFEDEQSPCEEFGSLGRNFNAMLSQLKDLRERNEIQSFALGRSESAVAVLHNVRNALAPLATILSHGVGQQDSARRDLVDRALAELAQGEMEPERRARLVAFLSTAFDAEALARTEVRRQLEVGRDAMRQTLEIIGAQQARAHERPARERCDISDIVARNATIARYAHAVSISFTFPAHSAYVVANRVILSQVIGNLFSNAVEAIVATGRDHGSITVDIPPPSEGRLSVRIIDDGEGFEPAQATRLFQTGYSTRTEKSGGLGLHWCANSMAGMGGALELRSAGRGTGAVAILTLDADGEGERQVELAA